MLAVFGAGTAGALAVRGPAATIVPFKSIAGIRLGDTRKQAQAALGSPKRQTPGPDGFLTYSTPDLLVELQHGVVSDLTTSDRRERTVNGLGPGSSLGAVKRAYPKATCIKLVCALEHTPDNSSGVGRYATDFNLAHQGGTLVVVAVVISDRKLLGTW